MSSGLLKKQRDARKVTSRDLIRAPHRIVPTLRCHPLSHRLHESPLPQGEEAFQAGMAALKSGDAATALEHLSECLRARTEAHGELDIRCASAYWRYGEALLLTAQSEGSAEDIFGPAVKRKIAARAVREAGIGAGAAEVEDDEERGDEVPAIDGDDAAAAADEPAEDNVAEDDAEAREEEDEGKAEGEEGEGGDALGSGEEEEEREEQGEEGEDPPDLDLAVENLDVARCLYEAALREAGGGDDPTAAAAAPADGAEGAPAAPAHTPAQLDFAAALIDVRSRLGDCHYEREDPAACREDLEAALSLIERWMPEDDDRACGVLTMLGLCALAERDFATAKQWTERGLARLVSRRTVLMAETIADDCDADAAAALAARRERVTSLISDLEDKLSEIDNARKAHMGSGDDMEARLRALVGSGAGGAGGSGGCRAGPSSGGAGPSSGAPAPGGPAQANPNPFAGGPRATGVVTVAPVRRPAPALVAGDCDGDIEPAAKRARISSVADAHPAVPAVPAFLVAAKALAAAKAEAEVKAQAE